MSNVTVYSTPTCPYCNSVKEFLTQKGISFKDVDVSADEAKAEEMIKKSGQMGVPVIDFSGQIIIGFDKPKLEAAVEKKSS